MNDQMPIPKPDGQDELYRQPAVITPGEVTVGQHYFEENRDEVNKPKPQSSEAGDKPPDEPNDKNEYNLAYSSKGIDKQNLLTPDVLKVPEMQNLGNVGIEAFVDVKTFKPQISEEVKVPKDDLHVSEDLAEILGIGASDNGMKDDGAKEKLPPKQ